MGLDPRPEPLFVGPILAHRPAEKLSYGLIHPDSSRPIGNGWSHFAQEI